MTFTTRGFSWSSVPKEAEHQEANMLPNVSLKGEFVSLVFAWREKAEAEVKNVKIPLRGNDFQTWCHAAVTIFFSRQKNTGGAETRGESEQRQGLVLLVWVSALVFCFHSKHLHAWKINQRHLRQISVSEGYRLNLSPPSLPVWPAYTLMIITVNKMNRSPMSQNQNNHQLFLSVIKRTIRTR